MESESDILPSYGHDSFWKWKILLPSSHCSGPIVHCVVKNHVSYSDVCGLLAMENQCNCPPYQVLTSANNISQWNCRCISSGIFKIKGSVGKVSGAWFRERTFATFHIPNTIWHRCCMRVHCNRQVLRRSLSFVRYKSLQWQSSLLYLSLMFVMKQIQIQFHGNKCQLSSAINLWFSWYLQSHFINWKHT